MPLLTKMMLSHFRLSRYFMPFADIVDFAAKLMILLRCQADAADISRLSLLR